MTLDCQGATPLQVTVLVVVGAVELLVDVAVPAVEEVVVGVAALLVVAGCVDDPAQALTTIRYERIQDKRSIGVLALHPLEPPLVGTALVQ